MNRVFRNFQAVVRGFVLFFLSILQKNMNCGKGVLLYKSVFLYKDKRSLIHIGDQVKINENANIAAVNGGEIHIGNGVSFGKGNSVISHCKVIIGDDTIMGPNVLIYDHDHKFDGSGGVKKKEFTTSPVSIGCNCWIGANTVILKGTHIGNRCVVGAGTVLKGTYPDNSLIVQRRDTDVIAIERR